MAIVKPSLWRISNEPANLTSVDIFGEIHDVHGCFTMRHTFVTRASKEKFSNLDFNFYLHDYGIVTGFKAIVGNKEVESMMYPKGDVPKQAQELIKKNFNNSATDSFICRVADVPPETVVQISISFLQTLHLAGINSVGFVIPTILLPKCYVSETQRGVPIYRETLRQYKLGIDLDVYMNMGAVSSVFSPSHSVMFSDRKIRLVRNQRDVKDVDLVILINMNDPIHKLLPKCYVDKHEAENIVMISTIPQYKPTFDFKEENEEGHPDPREVLFLVDPQLYSLQEIRMILNEALKQIDSQIYFNIIILGFIDHLNPYKIFTRSEEATKKNC